jgi:hypothetical protein
MNARRSTLAGLVSLCALAGTLAVLPAPAAAEECPNAAFRVGPSAHLPDCRAYEEVTPSFKDAGRVHMEGYGPEGDSGLLDIGAGPAGLEGFPDAGFATGPTAYFTQSRMAAGWTTTPDDPPTSEYEPYLENGFSDLGGVSLDHRTTVWTERKVGQPDNSVGIFLRRPDRSIVEVGPAMPPTAPSGLAEEVGRFAELRVHGVSADASHVFFSLEHGFWPSDHTEGGSASLYEYEGVGNATPMLVGVSDGTTVVDGRTLPAGEVLSRCGIQLGGTHYAFNAVSTDGDTVFFTPKPGCAGAPPVEEIFARIDNGSADARTVAISEPTEEDCAACYEKGKLVSAGQIANAVYMDASEDGSKVFFTTTQPLLGGDSSNNIYEYDFDAPAGERLVRVSAGDSTVSDPTAEVVAETIPVCSQDGSHVYFIAGGVLTTTPNSEGEAAEAGANNLYVFERDAAYPAGRTAFIARLSGRDVVYWGGSVFEGEGGYSGGQRGGDVTPDGRFLVFASNRDLTADDTSAIKQVFEYEAQTGALVRVSIGQDGFNHNGNVSSPYESTVIERPNYEDYSAALYWSAQSVSADGSYVFFQSIVGLTPQAFNEQVIGYTPEKNQPVYANNIYEYHDGRVSLISDGQDVTFNNAPDSSNTRLIGTDASGDDVLFTTADQLVGQDTDTNVDVYDARIGGGFPAPAPPPACAGEGCQGPLSAAPTLLSPAASSRPVPTRRWPVGR